MTPRILKDCDDMFCILYNSQTEIPLGRIIWGSNERLLTASEVAEKFIEYCGGEVPESLHEWEYRYQMFQESLNQEMP